MAGRPAPGLVLRRARTQPGLLITVAALVVVGATVLGLCALLLTTARDRALLSAVRSAEPSSVRVAVGVSLSDTVTATDVSATALAQVQAKAQEAFAAFPTNTSTWVVSAPRYLPALPNGDLRQTYLLDGDDLPSHATLTDGRWPTSGSAETEVALLGSTARLLGLQPGSTVTVATSPQHQREVPVEPTTVRVVGTFTPHRGDDAWGRDPLEAAGYAPRGGGLPVYGPLVVAHGTLVGHVPLARFNLVVTPDLRGATTSAVDVTAARLDRLRSDLDDTLGERAQGVALTDPFPRTVQQMKDQLGVAGSGVLVAALLVGAVAATGLGLAARLLADRRGAETALLVARGAGHGQLARDAGAEALALAVVAGGISIPLALVAFRALAGVPILAHTGLDAGTGPTAALVLTVVATAVVLSAVLVLGVLRPTGRRGRPTRRGVLARSGADLILVSLAVLGYLQLRAHGAATGSAPDPVLVGAPVLCLLAGAVVALRLVPWVARLAEVHAARSRRLVLPLAAWEVGRRRHSTAGVFLLVLGTAVATFACVFLATWHTSQGDQADARVGAQLQVDPGGAAPLVEGAALASSTGGEPEAVTLRPVALGSHLGLDASGAATQLLATDLASGLPLGRPPVGTSWTAATAPLVSGPPAGPALPTDGRFTLRVQGAAADGTALVVTPSLVVQDRWGGQAVLAGTPVALDGQPHEVVVSPAAGDEGAAPPRDLRLAALDLGLGLGPGADPPPAYDVTTTVTVRTVLVGGSPSADRAAPTWSGATADDSWQVVRNPQATEVQDHDGSAITATASVSVTGLQYQSGNLLVVAGAPVPEVPVLVTSALADELGARPGSPLSLTVGETSVDARVAGVVPYLPSVTSTRAVLADRTTLGRAMLGRHDLGSLTDRWWVGGLPDPTAAAVAVTGAALGTPLTRDQVASQLREGPLRTTFLAATWVLVVAAALLALVGTTAHVTASIGARTLEVARLLGLGVSRRAVRATFLLQHAVLCLLAVGTGGLVGAGVAQVVGPLLVVSTTGGRPVPEALVVWPWPVLATVVGIVLVGSSLVAVPVADAAVRRARAAHLRMDDQP